MAKNPKAIDTATPDAPTDAPTHVVAEAFGFTFDITTAPAHAVAYVVSFGFRQALSDATAGLAKAAMAAHAAQNDDYVEYCADAGLDPDTARHLAPSDFATAVCNAARKVRYDRIMSGAVATRGTGAPRATSGEKLALSIAKDWLIAAAAAKGKELPKDKEALAKLVADYRAKYADKIAAEIARRTENTPPMGDDSDF